MDAYQQKAQHPCIKMCIKITESPCYLKFISHSTHQHDNIMHVIAIKVLFSDGLYTLQNQPKTSTYRRQNICFFLQETNKLVYLRAIYNVKYKTRKNAYT